MALTANFDVSANWLDVTRIGEAAVPTDNGAKTTVEAGWDRSFSYSDAAFSMATHAINALDAFNLDIGNIDATDFPIEFDPGIEVFDKIIDPLGDETFDMVATEGDDTFDKIVVPGDEGFDRSLTDIINGLTTTLSSAPGAIGDPGGFTETVYSSAYLDRIRALLDSWVVGAATGLAPEVEQAIWNRGRDREVVASNQKVQEVIRSFSARGFSKPQGALSVEMNEAIQAGQNNVISLSREIMTKQADMEQANRRFALEQAWKIEEGLITNLSQRMTRALDAVKSLRDFAASIFQHRVSIFSAQVQGASSNAGAQAQIINASIGAQAQVISSNTGAQASVINANTGAKAQVITSNTSAQASVINANTGAKAQVISSNTDAQARVITSNTGAQASVINANISAQAQLLQARTSIAVAQNQVSIEIHKANLQKEIQRVNLALEAIKSSAQSASQLAASALAAVNISAGISSTVSETATNSTSRTATLSDSLSTGVSADYNYD